MMTNIETNMKHVVGFSGGIDSQACARWVLNRYPPENVLLLNSDAGGNEHPLTTEFIDWYSANVHPVVKVQAIIADLGGRGTRPGATKDRRDEFADTDLLTFDRLAYIKDVFPSRRKQFCTEHTGGIYRAAGWQPTDVKRYSSWSNATRKRPEDQAKSNKQRWELTLTPNEAI